MTGIAKTQMSRNVRKRTFGHLRPANIQITQSDLGLRWAHMSEGTFSRVEAYLSHVNVFNTDAFIL